LIPRRRIYATLFDERVDVATVDPYVPSDLVEVNSSLSDEATNEPYGHTKAVGSFSDGEQLCRGRYPVLQTSLTRQLSVDRHDFSFPVS
jgi:hypothetical protein